MTFPTVLVIDDLYGGSPFQRAHFIEKVTGLAPADPEPLILESNETRFQFCSGQVDRRNNIAVPEQAVANLWPPGRSEDWCALVLLDVQFSDAEDPHQDSFGFKILAGLRARFGPQLPIVMLTSQDEADRRRRANLAAADGYLPKEALSLAVFQRVLERHGLIPDTRPPSRVEERSRQRLIGRSLSLLSVLRDARRLAGTLQEGVGSQGGAKAGIIYGETGTGKTELAQYIHDYSRPEGPFVLWSAEGLNDDMVKDELFGHWYGAHSMAPSSEAGKVELAHSGTFFLDEVAHLRSEHQNLFMTVRRRDRAGYRTIQRQGNYPRRPDQLKQARDSVKGELQENHSIKIDVVMLSATNANLEDPEVRARYRFKRDLLNDLGNPLRVPGLNDRREDIEVLFRQLLGGRLGREAEIGSGVLEGLRSLDWKDQNIVVLQRVADEVAIQLGSDFTQVFPRHLDTALERVGKAEPDGATLPLRGTPSEPVAETGAFPVAGPRIHDLPALLDAVDVSENSQLRGVLLALHQAYGRLVVRTLGAALRRTQRRGQQSLLAALLLLLDRDHLTASMAGESTKAYDILKRLARSLTDPTDGQRDSAPQVVSDRDVDAVLQRAFKARQQKGK